MQSPVIQALADLEAAKARVDRDAARVKDEIRSQLVAELLPVLDNLDRSIAAGGEAGGAAGWWVAGPVARWHTKLPATRRFNESLAAL